MDTHLISTLEKIAIELKKINENLEKINRRLVFRNNFVRPESYRSFHGDFMPDEEDNGR